MDASTAVDTGAAGPTLRRPSPISAASSSSSSSPAPRQGNFSAAAAADDDDLPWSPVSGPPPEAAAYPGRRRSLAGIALRSFCLGAALVGGALLSALLALLPWLLRGSSESGTVLLSPAAVDVLAPLWRLPFYLAALAAFHFLEFWTTAAYNTPAASVHSFLLTANWPAYGIAHAAAVAECLLRCTLLRGRWWFSTTLPLPFPTQTLLAAGFAAVAVGQAVRTAAMVRAGRSFNHSIQYRRAASHVLVTDGIYGWLRHPSYFGFFWWAVGTQLVLGNTVCLAAHTAVLWRFFAQRIRYEEQVLVRFFGDDYVQYRKRVGTKIPFV